MSALISDDDYFGDEEFNELNEMDNERQIEVRDFLDAKYGENGTDYIFARRPEFYRFTVIEVACALGHLDDPSNYEY